MMGRSNYPVGHPDKDEHELTRILITDCVAEIRTQQLAMNEAAEKMRAAKRRLRAYLRKARKIGLTFPEPYGRAD